MRNERSSVVQTKVELHDFQDNYERASQRFHKQTSITATLILCCSIALPMLWMGSGPHFQSAEKTAEAQTQTHSDSEKCQGSRVDGLVGLLLLMIPLISLVIYIQIVNKNPYLYCPRCSKMLDSRRRPDLIETGMCPFCQQMILVGNLGSEQAALEFYEHKKSKRDHASVISCQEFSKVIFWMGMVFFLLAIPVFLWISSLEEVIGADAPYRCAIALIVFSIGLWLFSKWFQRVARRLEAALETEFKPK